MFLFILFAMSGVFFNDMLVLISIVGSIILFIGAFPNSPFKRLTGLAEWNSAPLVFGTFFHVCFLLLGMAPEFSTIGFVVPMPQGLVRLLLMAGRWWVRRMQTNPL